METPETLLPTTTAASEAPTTATDDIQAILQGWYYGGQTSGRAITCPDPQTFSVTSPYADCLNPEATAVATACNDNFLTYGDGEIQECASTVECFTMTVSRTLSNDDDVVTRYMCAKDWFYDTIYREEIVPATTTGTSSTTDSTSDRTMTTTTSRFPSPTSTISPDTHAASSESDTSSLSGGAIAGIVVGCIAALLILLLVFLRKRIANLFKKKQGPQEPVTEMLDSNEIYEIGTSSTGSAAKKKSEVQEIGIGK